MAAAAEVGLGRNQEPGAPSGASALARGRAFGPAHTVSQEHSQRARLEVEQPWDAVVTGSGPLGMCHHHQECTRGALRTRAASSGSLRRLFLPRVSPVEGMVETGALSWFLPWGLS